MAGYQKRGAIRGGRHHWLARDHAACGWGHDHAKAAQERLYMKPPRRGQRGDGAETPRPAMLGLYGAHMPFAGMKGSRFAPSLWEGEG